MKIGDRVKLRKKFRNKYHLINDTPGTVKGFIDGSPSIAIVFDSNIGGHNISMSGHSCKYGHGYYLAEKELLVIEENNGQLELF
jgi:hypothetical protein